MSIFTPKFHYGFMDLSFRLASMRLLSRMSMIFWQSWPGTSLLSSLTICLIASRWDFSYPRVSFIYDVNQATSNVWWVCVYSCNHSVQSRKLRSYMMNTFIKRNRFHLKYQFKYKNLTASLNDELCKGHKDLVHSRVQCVNPLKCTHIRVHRRSLELTHSRIEITHYLVIYR